MTVSYEAELDIRLKGDSQQIEIIRTLLEYITNENDVELEEL